MSSSDASYPGGHLAVAQLLQESLEPLFMVTMATHLTGMLAVFSYGSDVLCI